MIKLVILLQCLNEMENNFNACIEFFFCWLYCKHFVFILKSYAFIRERFALYRESLAFILESYALYYRERFAYMRVFVYLHTQHVI